MRPIMKRKPAPLTYRLLSAVIAFTFSFTSVVPPSYAQSIASLNLPVPGAMISPSAAFVPVLLKGMTIHPDNPLQFDFIIDSGNTDFKEDQIKSESERLVKYFLASMTLPKNDLWVNLSPYEKDRIIPDELGKTELGRDMLAQDYILKQLTASLMYPEKELGKEFWDKVYKQAQEKFGTTEIPVNTFNKVWILPETATVYEHGQTVYIVEARLRVMLDEDYQAREASLVKSEAQDKSRYASRDTRYGSEIIREIILPEIEREVNEGQNFAPLRQIYHSLILAKWYKETIKNSLLSKVYVDKKLINGIRLEDGQLKGKDGSIIDSQSSIVDQIYNQYMEAYKKGVFNYIKEDYDQLSAQPIPRKYFSGGFKGDVEIARTARRDGIEGSTVGKNYQLALEVAPQKQDAQSIPSTGPGTSSPVSINDLLTVPAGLFGALEEKGQILSVKAGEVFGIGFGDYWNQIQEFTVEYPDLVTIGGLLAATAGFTGGLYYFWSRYTISGNIHRLQSDDRETRRSAAEALEKLGDTRAVEPLIQVLKDSDSAVRRSATEALGKLGASKEQMLYGYLKALGSSDSGVRQSSAEALGKLGDTRAVEPLQKLLSVTPGILEYEETGQYGESWTHREDNPEYSNIADALARLRARPGEASSPVESRGLNTNIAQKMLMEGKIDLVDIKDGRLRKFLIFLKENNLTNIVVMGGAIKSILFNEEVADIDISVKTGLTDEERASFAPLGAAANERVYQDAVESVTRLAKAMGVDASVFLPPSRGLTKAFEGLNIDYFGPLQTGRGTVVKRSIFDTVTKRGYFTNTAADLLRFAIDAQGNIYGDVDSLRDLLQGKLTIQGDGMNFGINDVLRVLRIKQQYNLQISNEDYQLIKNAISRYKNQSMPPVALEVARDQIRKLLTSAIDPESAQQELEALGISAMLSSSSISSEEVGGIDMNSIDLDKQGAGVDIQFDPAELQDIIDAGIDGFAPVIINITPLPSVLPLLGLEPQRKEEELEVSSLN